MQSPGILRRKAFPWSLQTQPHPHHDKKQPQENPLGRKYPTKVTAVTTTAAPAYGFLVRGPDQLHRDEVADPDAPPDGQQVVLVGHNLLAELVDHVSDANPGGLGGLARGDAGHQETTAVLRTGSGRKRGKEQG